LVPALAQQQQQRRSREILAMGLVVAAAMLIHTQWAQQEALIMCLPGAITVLARAVAALRAEWDRSAVQPVLMVEAQAVGRLV
jgi:hypothetical protein